MLLRCPHILVPNHPSPSHKDLPYLQALYREVLRWHPTVPFNLPHATSKDDVYNGTAPQQPPRMQFYFSLRSCSSILGWLIPRGTVMIANHWYVLVISSIISRMFAFAGH